MTFLQIAFKSVFPDLMMLSFFLSLFCLELVLNDIGILTIVIFLECFNSVVFFGTVLWNLRSPGEFHGLTVHECIYMIICFKTLLL